jgi:hypothetical protein
MTGLQVALYVVAGLLTAAAAISALIVYVARNEERHDETQRAEDPWQR